MIVKYLRMEQYKIETIIAALIGGIGVLWHQLTKQVALNRTDQKEFSKALSEAVEVIAENNEIIREMKEFLKHERNK